MLKTLKEVYMSTKEKPQKYRGRDARTGRIVPLSETKRRPSTTVKERIKPRCK